MNFFVGFLLIVSDFNEEEAFWVFKGMAESHRFMINGLYEVCN